MASGIYSDDEAKLHAQRSEAVQVIETQLAVLVRLLEHHSRRAITYEQMDRASYLIARVLDREAPINIHGLAARLSLEPTTVTRKIASMEKTGLIVRLSNPDDKRVSLVDLSHSGRQKMDSVRDLRQRHNGILLSEWSLDDLENYGHLMREYNGRVSADTNRPSGENPFY